MAEPTGLAALQRRTVSLLAIATVLGGLGVGASLSAGALLITHVTGNEALSGFGSTMNAVGAAVVGIPLARFAARRGRRVALATGNLIALAGAVLVIAAAASGAIALLFVSLAVLGVASAVQLQARFAATDLAQPAHRARDLSLVVWAITIGAVTGPNLITPGEHLGAWLGLPALAGVFVFPILAQAAAALVMWVGLRPDPLLAAREIAASVSASAGVASPVAAVAAVDTNIAVSERVSRDTEAATGPRSAQLLVVAVVALAHAVMVGVMAMTPLHIVHHGGSVTLVGFTISLHIAGMYALSPLFGMVAGRVGRLPVVAAGLGVLGLAIVGTAFGGASMIVVQAALVLLGIGWSMVTVAGATLLTELTPLDARPRRQGQGDTAMNAAGALFGAVSGVIFAAGGFPLLSAIAGGILVAGAICVVLVPMRRRLTPGAQAAH